MTGIVGGGGGATGANPTGTIGLSAVNGSAATFLRSDGAPALSQAIAPTWTGLHTFDAGLAFGAQTVALGTTGAGVQGAWTRTDSTTGAGTVATNYEHHFGAVTVTTPTNAITITNEYGHFFEAPVAGTHLTFTNTWAAGFAAGINVTAGNIGMASGAEAGIIGNTSFIYTTNTNIEAKVQSSLVASISNGNGFPAGVQIGNSGLFSWSPNAQINSSSDTGLSRDSAGVIDVGNGSQGNKSGSINLTNMTASKKVIMSTSTALGNTGTLSLDPTLGEVFTSTPSGAMTVNAASAAVGTKVTLIVTTSGTTSFNITFNTSFKSQGVLATGTVSAKVFTVMFEGDGTNLNELSRTVAM